MKALLVKLGAYILRAVIEKIIEERSKGEQK